SCPILPFLRSSKHSHLCIFFFFFQAEDGIRDSSVTGVQTCALPIYVAFGQTVNPTEGHVDMYIDGAYSRLLTTVEPISVSLPSGPHVIRLQLVQTDGSLLAPDVSASVRVLTSHGPAVETPTIAIVWTTPGADTG